jgi:hypothetical protein
MSVVPAIEGSVSIQSPADRFIAAFRQRVVAGLLTGRPHFRSNYVVADAGPDRIEIRADDWQTAINVGLNTVQLRHVHPSTISYRIQYWRWAQFVLGLSTALGLVGLVLLLTLDVRGFIAGYLSSMIPGLSIDQNLRIAWLMVVFWGFVWPWLLIWLHKRPLHGLITRLIAEVDATNVPGPRR